MKIIKPSVEILTKVDGNSYTNERGCYYGFKSNERNDTCGI